MTLEPGEAERLSAFLGMSVTDFTQQYTRLKHSRDALSLTEADDGACVLLEADGSCRVQPVKPQQCIDFPHKWITPTLKKTCPALKELFSK